jgi:hypothetical protein
MPRVFGILAPNARTRQRANRENCSGAKSNLAALPNFDRLLLGRHCVLPARAAVPPTLLSIADEMIE